MPGEAVEQLTSEKLITRYIKGRAKLEWVLPSGRRNEDLDCAVYALAGAMWAGMDRWRDIDWQRLENKLLPKEEPAPDAPQAIPQQARRRRRGSIGSRS